MQTIDQPAHRIDAAERPLWIGQTPGAWGDVLRTIDPNEAQDAAAMIAAASLDWRVEQHPLEAVVGRENQSLRVAVPRHVANVRSDTRAVLGVVGEGYEPLQNRSAFAFCDGITDSGRAHWIGAGSTRAGARVHADEARPRGQDRGRGGGGRAAAALLPNYSEGHARDDAPDYSICSLANWYKFRSPHGAC